MHWETCAEQWLASQSPHDVAVLVAEQSELQRLCAHVSSTSALMAFSGDRAESHSQVHDDGAAAEKQLALQECSASHEPVPEGIPVPPEQAVDALCLKAQTASALQSVPAPAAHAMNTLLARQSVAQLVG